MAVDTVATRRRFTRAEYYRMAEAGILREDDRVELSYKERDAWAEDALLVIEVADSSQAYDRSTKRRLYAEAGIPEYWVVDCTAETVEVHRGPGPDGRHLRLSARYPPGPWTSSRP